ncbi:alpha-ketoglutarate-dependent dioxygenase AlkB [Gordonia sp. TBRC 11910]|uniref:Alpha-ketoglutarate-dependent dioxygenase AlkB n=1 Tax=Gordonia asplenii TaxID=2725283 RepID=A0A848L1K0_9ACTN|nr:alpha-ketoglutarate-dependent dioxygenase AlkB [Gordonia asplenii]NMO01528.1 alpha-ketoglutarate-dependent dioxygenase AlkB [Gordonia asplenii]
MSTGLQGSLFDQPADAPTLGELNREGTRRELTQGAWVDLHPNWLNGSDILFDRLRTRVPWRSERRQMYDRVVDVPRLVSVYDHTMPLPDPSLYRARTQLSEHYRPELPQGFATAGMCFYRDGNDSVAWHGDKIGHSATRDTLVAILSVGTSRPLLLRPALGGRSLRLTLGPGDLLVMGGSCQRTWEHAIPKVAGAGPRISIQFRELGVW